MAAFLKTVPVRTLYMAMAATVVLTLLACWLYLFKKPLAEYSMLKQTRTLLEAKVSGKSFLTDDIGALVTQVEDLRRQVQGKQPVLPMNEIVAHTVARLDSVSGLHAVQLLSVKPGSSTRKDTFEELPFSISVSGGYQNLYSWLGDVERELGPMVVKQLEVKPERAADTLTMDLEMVSYKPYWGEP